MNALSKSSLYLLSAYTVCIVVYAALAWNDLLLTQQLAVIATAIVTMHEWEEQRFPGGFLETISSALGVDTAGVSAHRMYSKPDLLIFVMSALALFLPQFPFFACAMLVFGIIEGITHIAGIKLAHLKRPYTPGMVTGEIYAIFSIVGIVLLAQSGMVGALDWVLAVAWFILCFATMELSIWRVVGMKPEEIPQKVKAAIGRTRGK